jgi:hypothetical protein
MFGSLFGGLGDDRHIQVSTDDLCDLSEWHAFLCDRVVMAPGRTFFQRKPEKSSGIEAVHGRPTIFSVSHVGRNALLARGVDETTD